MDRLLEEMFKRERTDKVLDGYLTLFAAKKALDNRDMFDNLVRSL